MMRYMKYFLMTFYNYVYEGILKIMEPLKCYKLTWFPISKLLKEIIDTIVDYLSQKLYSGYGFIN